jgi:two-component system, NarL family, invasion response regulator UvrY
MGERQVGSDSGFREDTPGDVTVLVVEDHDHFRSTLCDLVTFTEGFALGGEAATGEAALRAVDELSPRLVLMDKRMPGIDGIETCRMLKDRHPETVVVLISVEDAVNPQVLQSCGAAEFVSKTGLSPAVLQEVWQRHGS